VHLRQKRGHQLDTPRRNLCLVVLVTGPACGRVVVGRDLHIVVALLAARPRDVVDGHVAVDAAEISGVDQIQVRL